MPRMRRISTALALLTRYPRQSRASLQLSEAVLVVVGVPMGPVIAAIDEKRAALQDAIKAMAPEARVRTLGRRRLRDRL